MWASWHGLSNLPHLQKWGGARLGSGHYILPHPSPFMGERVVVGRDLQLS